MSDHSLVESTNTKEAQENPDSSSHILEKTPSSSVLFQACPYAECISHQGNTPFRYVKNGSFTRTSDHMRILCFRCKCCKRSFSAARQEPEFNQNKRQINDNLLSMLGSGTSMRRASLNLKTTRKTIARKLRFLAGLCQQKNQQLLEEHKGIASVQFDEMESFEHTKCKPVAIALAVEKRTRLILGAQVASMPANGPLAKTAMKKYGPRPNERRAALEGLLSSIKPLLEPQVLMESDKCPLYPSAIKRALGRDSSLMVTYVQHKGKRGCVTGQGELKKIGNDPLFSLNHTAAMLRANINRLFRRTWNTSKRMDRLLDHIRIYAYWHNAYLLNHPSKSY